MFYLFQKKFSLTAKMVSRDLLGENENDIRKFIGDGYLASDVVSGRIGQRQLEAKAIDLDTMAERLVKEILKQYILDGFIQDNFHASSLIFLPDSQLVFFDFSAINESRKESRLLLLDFFHALSQENTFDSSLFFVGFYQQPLEEEIRKYIKIQATASRREQIREYSEMAKREFFKEFKKDADRIIGSYLEDVNKKENVAGKSLAVLFFELIKRGEKAGFRLSAGIELFILNFFAAEKIALQISPFFDIFKVLDKFFNEFPTDELRGKIENEKNVDIKITRTDSSWEKFNKKSLSHREMDWELKYKMKEAFLNYAEKYPDLRKHFEKLKI